MPTCTNSYTSAQLFQLHQSFGATFAPRVAASATTVMTVLDGQGSEDRLSEQCRHWEHVYDNGSGNHWECYEGGAWRQYPEFENKFLEEQILSGVETCVEIRGDARNEWNFPDLTHTRKERRDDGQWVTVKTRSIRRVIVLAAPERPVED